MKALHFGAGNIGKGFIGNLLNKSGYEVCFVDVNQESIDSINRRHSYFIELLDEEHTVETISPVSALNSITQEDRVIEAIKSADMITTSVGAPNLTRISKILGVGLLQRSAENPKPVDVIANENAINASSLLKSEIRKTVTETEMQQIEAFTGFPNSAIDRLALSKKSGDEERALVEPFYEWVINKSEMKNHELPLISGAIYVDDLQPYIERKIYIVNMGHAAAAYMGFVVEEPTIQAALRNPEVKTVVKGAMEEASQYIIHTYGSKPEEMDRFIEKTLSRFGNSNISDDIYRVGRAPIRKLGFDERLVRPAREVFNLGLPVDNLTAAIAAGYLFNNPDDEESVEIQDYIAEKGIEAAIMHFSKITETDIKNKILSHFESMKKLYTGTY